MFVSGGVSFGGLFANFPAMGAMGGLGPFGRLLLVGLFLVWAAPNCQQLFNYDGMGPSENVSTKWRLSWQPKPWFAILFGCLFYLSVSKMDKLSPFLYYQF